MYVNTIFTININTVMVGRSHPPEKGDKAPPICLVSTVLYCTQYDSSGKRRGKKKKNGGKQSANAPVAKKTDELRKPLE